MINLNNIIQKNKFRTAVVIGSIFIVIGICLFSYSTSAIYECEQILNSPDLSLEETWKYEGSLAWWRKAYSTLFFPLTLIFVISGIMGIIYQPLLTTLHHRNILETFADNVKRASIANYERSKLYQRIRTTDNE